MTPIPKVQHLVYNFDADQFIDAGDYDVIKFYVMKIDLYEDSFVRSSFVIRFNLPDIQEIELRLNPGSAESIVDHIMQKCVAKDIFSIAAPADVSFMRCPDAPLIGGYRENLFMVDPYIYKERQLQKCTS